jgi:hypothetical protein
MTKLEKDVQSAILDYLAIKHYFFWRSNNTPIFDSKRQIFRGMPKYALHGTPDIIVIHNGKFIGLECKSDKGKQSESQIKFQKGCIDAGGTYAVVRSIDDVQAIGL